MNLLITGATGFIGHTLSGYIDKSEFAVAATVRTHDNSLPTHIRQIKIGNLLPDTNWTQALSGVDVIIHLAARVHVMQKTAVDSLATFRKTNTAGTLNLARQAAVAGVRRFIYLSSIKVNGEYTSDGKPFTVESPCIPTNPYGLSKYEAEQGLRELTLCTSMQVVIIRSPLVYGPGVKANFLNMIEWLQKGIPLPLGAIHNQRSLVALDNLVDFIVTCIVHPAAGNQTFLVSDGEDLSTTELLHRMGQALGKPVLLLPIPQRLLTASLTLCGKRSMAQRLCSSLQIDSSKTRKLLDWTPPINVNEALHRIAQSFLRSYT